MHRLNDEISRSRKLLSDYNIFCKLKTQELENINSKISRILTLVNRFKKDNEEYLKIKQTVEEVSSVLTDGKVLLQFALTSVIESIRRNSGKYNNLLVHNISSSTAVPAQQSPLWHIEGYKNMILDEANRLYDRLLKFLTNSIMDNIACTSSKSSLSSTFPILSNQSD